MPEVKRPPARSASEYRTSIQESIRLYEAHDAIQTWEKHRRHVLALAGLEQEVMASAYAVQALAKVGQHDACAVHIRKALEFSVVAQWIHVTDDGLPRFEYKSEKNTTALFDEAVKANMWIPQEIAHLLAAPAEQGPDDIKAMGSFRSVADSFGEGGGIYLMYRSLSGECHPNVNTIVKHLQDDPTASGGVGLHLGGGVESASWLFTLAVSLIWAARPVDDRTKFKPRKKELQRIARHLGVPSQLKPVPFTPGKKKP